MFAEHRRGLEWPPRIDDAERRHALGATGGEPQRITLTFQPDGEVKLGGSGDRIVFGEYFPADTGGVFLRVKDTVLNLYCDKFDDYMVYYYAVSPLTDRIVADAARPYLTRP